MIERLDVAEDDAARLMSLGVCAGRTVELIQAGDPLILKVFASRIGLSARLAQGVFVTPVTRSRRTDAGRGPT